MSRSNIFKNPTQLIDLKLQKKQGWIIEYKLTVSVIWWEKSYIKIDKLEMWVFTLDCWRLWMNNP